MYYIISLLNTGHHDHRLGTTATDLDEVTFKVANRINPLNAKLNPTCHLLALFEAHHILHVSRIRVNMVQDGVSPLDIVKQQ
jgi:hypothetical protein